jgi:hypothetical protein
MCGDDWDGQVLREERRKARKVHYCAECPKLIQPGEHYVITATLTDGHVSTYKLCLKCDRIVTAHFAAERALGHYGGSFILGELVSQVRECIREEKAYVGNFRKAWRGEKLPPYVRPDPRAGTYSSVNV